MDIKKIVLHKLVIALFLFVAIYIKSNDTAYAYNFVPTDVYAYPGFDGSTFDANDTIEIPIVVHKYSNLEYGSVYVEVYNEDNQRVFYSYKSISDFSLGKTNYTVFNNKTPHKLGDYTVKYYTSNNEGGTYSFSVTKATGKCGINVKWEVGLNGKLEISGVGAMTNYEYFSPFQDYKDIVTSVEIKSGVTTIGKNAFDEMYSINQIDIPDSVTTIGMYSFSRCSSLSSVVIPNSVIKIEWGAFSKCSSLRTVSIPNSVLSIEGYVFYNCILLDNVILPSGISAIEYNTFADCSSLKTITVPKSVKKIHSSAFEGSILSKIVYNGSAEDWKSIDISSMNNDGFLSAHKDFTEKTVTGGDTGNSKPTAAKKQSLKVSKSKVTFKHSNAKEKSLSTKITIKNAKTKLSAKSSNKKISAKISGNKLTIKTKKGIKKGTYKVTVTAAKTSKYKSASKVIKVVVK